MLFEKTAAEKQSKKWKGELLSRAAAASWLDCSWA
jgi:hypothetical protein